jgi:hypothetical protein
VVGRDAALPCCCLQKASASALARAWSGYSTSLVVPAQVVRGADGVDGPARGGGRGDAAKAFQAGRQELAQGGQAHGRSEGGGALALTSRAARAGGSLGGAGGGG